MTIREDRDGSNLIYRTSETLLLCHEDTIVTADLIRYVTLSAISALGMGTCDWEM